jgi:hypothetical protein
MCNSFIIIKPIKMKQLMKIGLVVVGMLLCLGSFAQSPTSLKATWGESSPTGSATLATTNTTPGYLYSQAIVGYKDVTNITVASIEVTGTTAGTLTLEASMDGTNWYNVYNSTDTTYSFALSDVTTSQVYRWQLLGVANKYYRVKSTGSGSPSYTTTAKIESWKK